MSFIQEAVAQWVWAYGAERPEQCWILSDYDTWHRNPHYNGPDQQHPEDYGFDEDVPEDGMTDVEADADALRNIGWGTDEDYGYSDDIPF